MTSIRHSARAVSSPLSDEIIATYGPGNQLLHRISSLSDAKGASIDFLLAAQVMSVHDVGCAIAEEMQLKLTGLLVEASADYNEQKDSLHIYLNLKPEVDAHHRDLVLWLQTIEQKCHVTRMIALSGKVVSSITHFTLN